MSNFDDSVEKLIDSAGVQRLLDSISDICAEKSEHILESYDDRPLARLWMQTGIAVGKLAAKIRL